MSAGPIAAHRRVTDDLECPAASNNVCSSYSDHSFTPLPVPGTVEELDHICQNTLVERIVKHEPAVSIDQIGGLKAHFI